VKEVRLLFIFFAFSKENEPKEVVSGHLPACGESPALLGVAESLKNARFNQFKAWARLMAVSAKHNQN